MRLIDADALLKDINDYPYGYRGMIKDTIAEQPTVEVVRCKDCRFSHMTYSGECKSCDKWVDDDDFHLTLYLDGDFYCAWGEKKR